MAIEQIENALQPPQFCDACCSVNVELTTNDKIYGRIFGNWPHIYMCHDCGAMVGCHPETFIPLGRMGDKETRTLRREAHAAFDPIWQSGLMTRAKAYKWLSEELNIDSESCHISWLSKEQLKAAAELAAVYFNERVYLVERRKVKRNAKNIRQREFERSRIRARKAGR